MLYRNFIEYWDEWHRNWYRQCKKWLNEGYEPVDGDLFSVRPLKDDSVFYDVPYSVREKSKQTFIKEHGWTLPFKNGSCVNAIDNIACWKYFPAPYWGNPKNQELKAIIINTNQHVAGDEQNIILGCYKDLYLTYRNHHYSTTVMSMLTANYLTTNAYLNNNLVKISELFEVAQNPTMVKTEDILQMFLAPWFTRQGNAIGASYLERNASIIYQRILKPAAQLSKSLPEPLNKVVLVRSNALHRSKLSDIDNRYFNVDISAEKALLEKLSSNNPDLELSFFEIDGAIFINFYLHGGEYLPSNTTAIAETIHYVKSIAHK